MIEKMTPLDELLACYGMILHEGYESIVQSFDNGEKEYKRFVEFEKPARKELTELRLRLTAQADIIQQYAIHGHYCQIEDIDKGRPCTCGLSAALAALRKLQGDAP